MDMIMLCFKWFMDGVRGGWIMFIRAMVVTYTRHYELLPSKPGNNATLNYRQEDWWVSGTCVMHQLLQLN